MVHVNHSTHAMSSLGKVGVIEIWATFVILPRLAAVEAELEFAAAGHVVAALRAFYPELALRTLLAVFIPKVLFYFIFFRVGVLGLIFLAGCAWMDWSSARDAIFLLALRASKQGRSRFQRGQLTVGSQALEHPLLQLFAPLMHFLISFSQSL